MGGCFPECVGSGQRMRENIHTAKFRFYDYNRENINAARTKITPKILSLLIRSLKNRFAITLPAISDSAFTIGYKIIASTLAAARV